MEDERIVYWISCRYVPMYLPQFPRFPDCVHIYLNLWLAWSKLVGR